MSPAAPPTELEGLVERFQRHVNPTTPEVTIQTDYVEALFRILGWDTTHGAGDYDRQNYSRGVGSADGVLLLERPVIYVEVKRFGRILSTAERSRRRVYRTPEEQQALRYTRDPRGRVRAPYAILTNFQRLVVFDAQTEEIVLAFDNPRDYLSRYEELQLLSKESIASGRLARWYRREQKPPVDDEFLDLLNTWRVKLAQAIYDHNPDRRVWLAGKDGTYSPLLAVVQRLLTRLIIVQAADDKDLLDCQSDRGLWALEVADYQARRADPYSARRPLAEAVRQVCENFWGRHNSALFRPGHPCEQVAIPDDTLEEILTQLSSLNFRRLSPDILSATYESYLGKTLEFDPVSQRFRLRDKSDYRHGQGIYYTRAYVARTILEETLGRYLEGKTPEEITELRLVDPACGSGTFLIHAFDILWEFYDRHARERSRRREELSTLHDGCQTGIGHVLSEADGDYGPPPVLDYARRILERHLYGVDLDPEAAEMAAANLLLRAFERMGQEVGYRDAKLPLLLNQNIKVGNSLIGVPVRAQEPRDAPRPADLGRLVRLRADLVELVRRTAAGDRAELERLDELLGNQTALAADIAADLEGDTATAIPQGASRFHWWVEFPEVFFDATGALLERPGFTFVVGNPPYIRIQELNRQHREHVEYYRSTYAFAHGSYDLYVLFVERALQLLAEGGVMGYILPNKFLTAEYGCKLRAYVGQHGCLQRLVDFGDNQLFDDGTTSTALLYLARHRHTDRTRSWDYVAVPPLNRVHEELPPILSRVAEWRPDDDAAGIAPAVAGQFNHEGLDGGPWAFVIGDERDLWDKLDAVPTRLGDLAARIFQGLISSADDVYILEEVAPPDDHWVSVRSRADGRQYELEVELLKPLLSGRHVRRLQLVTPHQRLLFPYELTEQGARLIPPDVMAARYPRVWSYLCAHEQRLRGRERGKMHHDQWYGYVYPKNLDLHQHPKLALPRLVPRSTAAPDLKGCYYLDNVDVNGCLLRRPDHDWHLYVAAVLNSDPVDYYLRRISGRFQNRYYGQNKQFAERLPVPVPGRPDPLQDPGVRAVVDLASHVMRVKSNMDRLLYHFRQVLAVWPHRWLPLNRRVTGVGRSRRVETGYIGDSRFDRVLRRHALAVGVDVERATAVAIRGSGTGLVLAVRDQDRWLDVQRLEIEHEAFRRFLRLGVELFLQQDRRRHWGSGSAVSVVLNAVEAPRLLDERGRPLDATETLELARRVIDQVQDRLQAEDAAYHTDLDALMETAERLEIEMNERVMDLFGLDAHERAVLKRALADDSTDGRD